LLGRNALFILNSTQGIFFGFIYSAYFSQQILTPDDY